MAEVIAGAGATATTSGAGAPWAIPLILHGIDQVVAGAAQVVTGEQTHSRLEKIVAATAEAGGVSPQKAEVIGSVVDAVTGLALTAGVGSGQALTRAVATEPQVVNALAKEVEVGTVVAKAAAFKPVVNPDTLKMTNTVADHLGDVVKAGPHAGQLERPFLKSKFLLKEIMEAKVPIPDPRKVPGALRWDVPGTFRGKEGVWELVVDPVSETILHWNFVGI